MGRGTTGLPGVSNEIILDSDAMASPSIPLQQPFWLLLLALLLLVPFNVLVGLGLFLSELVYLPFSLFHKRAQKLKVLDKDLASLIILNWEGKHLLDEFLPSVVEAVKRDGRNHEIIVVDNGSHDGSVSFLEAQFPQVKVVALSHNYRFTGGNNSGVQVAKNDIVILLNNDMQVEPGFLRPLLEAFRDETVFGVSCQVFFQDKSRRREETGNTKAQWSQGFVNPYHDEISDGQVARYHPILWAGGGSSAFDRRKFLALGGLDTLYDPFYLEDVDLSYQAWKRGWKSLLAIDSVVIHKHRATNKQKFGDNYVDNTIRKNQYLFVWKNITNVQWILEHGLFLSINQARFMVQTNICFEIKAYFRALVQFPEALYKRFFWRHYFCMGDPQIFAETSKPSR